MTIRAEKRPDVRIRPTHRPGWLVLPLLLAAGGASAASAPPLRGHVHANDSAASAPTLRGHVHANDLQAWSFEIGLERPAPVELTCDEVGGDRERHLKRLAAATRSSATLHGLKASTRYQCVATAMDGSNHRSAPVSFLTAPLPADLKPPQITVASTDVADTGYTMYNYGIYRGGFKNNYLVILDAKGLVRWYLPGPGAGDVDSSYLGDDRILYGGMSAAYYPPTIVGLDKATQWKATTATAAPYETPGSTNHDAGLSEDGKSVFHLNYEELDGYYLVYVVKQIDLATNKVIWTWDSIVDGLESGELPPGGGSSDLYHGNTVDDQWENGRLYLYVGMRNLHEVIKIDYLTKEVVWHLGVNGDFDLLEADGTPAADSRWFFHQHDIKVYGPDLFSAYDNGTARNNYGGTNYSRALQLELDQEEMTARIAFEYKESGWVEAYWGGYDVFDTGSSLIAMGHFSSGSSSHNSALVELSPGGTVVWRADFRSDKDAIYRAERLGGCDIFDNTQYCPNGR